MVDHPTSLDLWWAMKDQTQMNRFMNWHSWALWAFLVWLLRMGECQFGSQCEEIKIPMCLNMPYNLTRLPNLLHHSTQENAQLAVDQFELLRWTKCSDQLEFFLCAMYAPICTREFLSEAIPPCRSVCESARRGCEPLLARFSIPWPSNLECSSLPLYDRGVCITPEAIISSDSVPRQEVAEVPCECGTEKKLRQKLYKARHFHYVIRGTVKSVDTFGGLTLTTATVNEVVRAGRVHLLVGGDAHLWTNRSCACPPLTPTNEYIILGWEDFANSRLLYLDGSLAVPYRKRYVRKIKTWDASTKSTTESGVTVDVTATQLLPVQPYPQSMQVGNSKKEMKRKRDRGNRGKKKKGRRKNKRRKKSRTRKNNTTDGHSEN